MAFKYRLALLYKLAKEKERQEQMELGRLIKERVNVSDRVRDIGEKMGYWYGQYDSFSWDPKETNLIENHLSFIDKQRQQLLANLKELEGKIKAKRAEVNEAHKNKKKYETHEGYKRQEHDQIVRTQEARVMSDILEMHVLRKKYTEASV